MRSVTYVGRYKAVEIEVAPERWRRVNRGESIEVPDRRAERLLEQDAWTSPDVVAEVPEGTVDEVLAWVGDDPQQAATARDAERAGKNRKSLLARLDEIAGGPAGDTSTGAERTEEG